MKYLDNFNNYEKIDEKIKFKDIALSLMLLWSGHAVDDIKLYKASKEIYTEIKSSASDPKGKDKEMVEDIRKKVIEEIKISQLFKDSHKEYIIDSIQTATITFEFISFITPAFTILLFNVFHLAKISLFDFK